jgi:methyl-accepting chemotaxis protein
VVASEVKARAMQTARATDDIASAATREISRNTQQAATNTAQVMETIAGLNRLAVESRTPASEELASAQETGRRPALLGDEIRQFLGEIRVA